ncbi:MAG: NTP transferase domain-containing protein [Solirubrobacterales bacterium]
MIAALILAAGAGSRFGGPKQIAELRGRPLIELAIEAVAVVPAIERIVVVLGAEAELIRNRADLSGVEVVVAPDWEEGMAASLRAGVAAVGDAEAVLITLADQPLITPHVVAAVLDRMDSPAPAARATYDGRPGHPVLIKRELFEDVSVLSGDAGARDLLDLVGVATVECGHLASDHDVDTRANLEAIGGEV